jgi:hypothetical protein
VIRQQRQSDKVTLHAVVNDCNLTLLAAGHVLKMSPVQKMTSP